MSRQHGRIRFGLDEYTKFIALRIGEHGPAVAVLPAIERERGSANTAHAVNLRLEVAYAKIEVHPVLRLLGFGNALQK